MSRTKSEFVSGMGTGFEIVKAISDEVRSLGGGDDDLRRVIAQAGLRRRIAEMIMEQGGSKDKGEELTLGDRTYEVLGFLRDHEDYIRGDEIVRRAKEMNANLGEDDGQYILDHQDQIPTAYRGKIIFVFTDWRHPDDSEYVYYVYWHGSRWIKNWDWIGSVCSGRFRVLRRK